jgi:hypothetical protein
MDDLDHLAFAALLKEAYKKCFGAGLGNPMTEAEGKIFCNKVLDQTGLSLGWKSVKNYSIFITSPESGRQENPSIATLDTFARYVLGAPYTTELQRRDRESHFPYWFMYREKFVANFKQKTPPQVNKKLLLWAVVLCITALLVTVCVMLFPRRSPAFTDDFKNVSESGLSANGWLVKSGDTAYWNRRDEIPGQLTLFTLRGDNWPDPSAHPVIHNLLLHKLPSQCFTAEVHFKDFIPKEEWQQAGILLLEDTSLTGKSIRVSLAFNDNFGGMKKASEVLVQVITSLGNGFGKPEEIAHKSLYSADSTGANNLALKNLENSALRIEKHGNTYRFLYANGMLENSAFHQVATQQFAMAPKYIGIFALKGFTNSANVPVRFKFFKLTGTSCD